MGRVPDGVGAVTDAELVERAYLVLIDAFGIDATRRFRSLVRAEDNERERLRRMWSDLKAKLDELRGTKETS